MASQRLRGGTNGSGPESARNASGFAAMTRAEKFEGEKKRIIESCFGKKDQDGACMCRDHPFSQFIPGSGATLLAAH
jgi:hypothetical protein